MNYAIYRKTSEFKAGCPKISHDVIESRVFSEKNSAMDELKSRILDAEEMGAPYSDGELFIKRIECGL